MNKWIVRLLVGIVIFVLFIRYINVVDSLYLLLLVRWDFLILALLSVFFLNVLRAARLHYLTGRTIDVKRNFLVHNFVPLLSLATPFKLGEGYKVFLLGKSKKELGFAYILEKITDTIILFVIALSGIFLLTQFFEITLVFVAFVVLGVLLLLNIERVLNFVLRKRSFEKKWFSTNLRQIRKPTWIIFILFSFLIFVDGVCIFYFFSLAIGADISFVAAIFFIGVITFVSIVSSLPGGLGVRELTTSFLFINFLGTSSSLAGAVSLIVLIGNNLMLLALFLITYPLYRRMYKKSDN